LKQPSKIRRDIEKNVILKIKDSSTERENAYVDKMEDEALDYTPGQGGAS